jgi:hypothetical protein
MSQARLCLDGMRKVQCVRDEFGEAICLLKRGLAVDVSVREGGGGPFGFAPPSATSLHSPMRRGRLAGREPATSLPCRRHAWAAVGTDMNAAFTNCAFADMQI